MDRVAVWEISLPARHASACWSLVAAARTNKRCADFCSSLCVMISGTVEVWVEVWPVEMAKPHSERNVRQHVVTDAIFQSPRNAHIMTDAHEH